MIAIDDFRWPSSDVRGRKAIIPEAREAIPYFLQWMPRRRKIVQAGGNVGVYPFLLAEVFDHVETYEPDKQNFDCMAWNLRDETRVSMSPFPLGEVSGQRLRFNETEPDNCGAHTFHPSEDGTHTTIALDDVHRHDLDVIWLDVEGAELPTLRGAVKSIKAFAPVIVLEEKGHGKLFGWSHDELHAFLAGLGYSEKARFNNDRLYTQ